MMEIVGLGAGGHAKVMIEILQLTDSYRLVGLLDPKREMWGETVLGVPILGDDGKLSELYSQGVRNAFIGLGGAANTGPRRRLYELARGHGFDIVPAVHPKAVVSPSAEIGHGPAILAGAIINACATLGENLLVNTAAIVEHDSIIGDHAHIATGARLASTVRVGVGAHVGAGATVRQSIDIGEGAIVGAGAVVVKDVAPWTVVVGVPARVLRTLQPAGIDAGHVEDGP